MWIAFCVYYIGVLNTSTSTRYETIVLQTRISTWPAVEVVCLLQVKGNITYNGKNFHEFQAVHTSAYVDQNDLHQAELTVRETLDFAARCQGIGHKGGQPLLQCRSVFVAMPCRCSHIPVVVTAGVQ